MTKLPKKLIGTSQECSAPTLEKQLDTTLQEKETAFDTTLQEKETASGTVCLVSVNWRYMPRNYK